MLWRKPYQMLLERNKMNEYKRNILLNYIFKILAMGISMLCVRANIQYLGSHLYGLWAAMSSVISWMGSGDFGIGNGLRNELTKAFAENDERKEKKLLFSAMVSLGRVSAGLMAVLVIMCEIFYASGILDSMVRIPMYITGIFFCVNLILGVFQAAAYSFQKSWLVSMAGLVTPLTSFLLVYGLMAADVKADLLLFSFINGAAVTIANLILCIYFSTQGITVTLAAVKTNYDRNAADKIVNTGLQFFGIQICAVILYSTDNLIINKLFDSSQVTKYAVITKIYDTGNSIFSILLISFWSAVTFQIAKGNAEWIRKNIRRLLAVWLFFSIGVAGVSANINWIVKLWLGESADFYSKDIVILFGAYSCITAFSAIYANVLNGLGIIRLQFILAVCGAIINIPLSVFFAKGLGMEIMGVKLATFISVVTGAVCMPLQVYFLMRRWNGIKPDGDLENENII